MQEDQCRYVILCRERTGSNYLVHLLGQHPEITGHNELFHEQAIFLADEAIYDGDVIRDRNADPVGFLERVMSQCHTRICGFKHQLFYDTRIIELVLSGGWRVLMLERENILAQYSSVLIAQQTGQWTLKKGDQAVAGQALEWNEGEFDHYWRGCEQEYQALYERIKASEVIWLKLRYGELFNQAMVQRIFEFVGAKGEAMTDEAIRKQNSSRIAERFSEPDRVRAYLARIDKEDWEEERVSS